jgi:hypothetical protein
MKIATYYSLLSLFVWAQVPTTLPTFSDECQAYFSDQASKLESPCGIKLSDFTNLTTIEYSAILNSATQSLEKVCSSQCEDALKASAAEIKAKSECLIDIAPDLNIGDFAGVYEAGRNALCAKTTDGTHCVVEQVKTLKPILEKFDPNNVQATVLSAIADKAFVCTDCFQKQVEALQSADLPGELKTQFESITTSLKDVCSSNLTNADENHTQIASSGLTPVPVLFAAIGLAAIIL